MAYLTQAQQTNRPGAIAGVIAIHAGLGFVLVTGLGTAIVETINPGPIIATQIPTDPPPPPPPPTSDPTVELPKVAPKPHVPPTSGLLPPVGPPIGTTEPNFGELIPYTTPKVAPLPGTGPMIEPLPSINIVEAIGAAPSNDRSRWVTQRDYRTRWIREEMTGTASFRLGIGANGKVNSCSITRSSGHSQLDDATCKLVSRRAKFNPARNTKDQKVTGSYTGTVQWQLPE